MHIPQLLDMLLSTVHIEVMVACLPELRRLINFKKQLLVGIVSSTLRSHLTRHALLQHLHDGRDGSTYRFTDQQVKVLGHDHIAGNNEIVFAPDFFKNLEEEISSSRRFQELSATIATACNEMTLAAT